MNFGTLVRNQRLNIAVLECSRERRRDSKLLAIFSILCFTFFSQSVYAKAATNPAPLSGANRDANDVFSALNKSASVQNVALVGRDYYVNSASSQMMPEQSVGILRSPVNPSTRQTFSMGQLSVDRIVTSPALDKAGTACGFESLAQLDNEKSEPAAREGREGAADDSIDDPVTLTQVATKTATTATSQLDIALGHRGVYSDLLSLQDRILDSQRPVANAVSRYSTQSDNLNIFWEEVSQDIFFADGADRLRPGVQYIDYSPLSGPGVRQYSAGADGTYRFNELASLSGDFWLNDIHPQTLKSDIIPTYDLFLTLVPNDYVRVDLDTKREIFDNIRSLQLGINAESVGGSADYSPTDYLRLTLRGAGSFYSDTNERQFGEVEAVWRVLTGPTVEVGVRGSAFHFSKQLNDGYFNPNRYVSGEAIFRVQTELTERLTAELAGAGGIENVDPGGSKPLVKGSLQLIYKLTDRWNLDGGISYFSSQDSSSSGFARTSYTLGLHYKFD